MTEIKTSFIYLGCQFCRKTCQVDVHWARYNKFIFCETCCKSFEVDEKDLDEDDFMNYNSSAEENE